MKLGIALMTMLADSNLSLRPIGGHSSLKRALLRMRTLSHLDVESIHFSLRKQEKERALVSEFISENHMSMRNCIVDNVLAQDILTALLSLFRGCTDIVFVWSDAPFQDLHALKNLIAKHGEALVDYSFMEHYISGLESEVVSMDVLHDLSKLDFLFDGVLWSRDWLKETVLRRVNEYDVEVLVSPEDDRKERLRLIADSPFNMEVMCRLAMHLSQTHPSAQDLALIIKNYPECIRPHPAWVEIEITNECPSRCSICPRTHLLRRPERRMSRKEYGVILQKLKAFCSETTIVFGGLGEPAEHPEVIDFIEDTLRVPFFSLTLETSIWPWNTKQLERLIAQDPDKFKIIVALDSPDKFLYRRLREKDKLDEAEQKAVFLLEKGKGNVYLQILRLKENENFIDEFYNKWNAYRDRIIVQKYNDYQGRLEDKSALSWVPLKRFPCCHLRRGLSILSDGTIPFCKQDINAKFFQGNALTQKLSDVWKGMDLAHRKDRLGQLHPSCVQCKEWFVFTY